jgi:lipoprotein-releasing system ATP-binding protein
LHPLAAADEMAPEAGPSDDGHAGG